MGKDDAKKPAAKQKKRPAVDKAAAVDAAKKQPDKRSKTIVVKNIQPASTGSEPVDKPDSHSTEILKETVENIGTGARVVGEKAAELAGEWLGVLKKGVAMTYGSSAKVAEELTQSTKELTSKLKDEVALRKMRQEVEPLYAHIGEAVFNEHRSKGKVTPTFFEAPDIAESIARSRSLNDEIAMISTTLEKSR